MTQTATTPTPDALPSERVVAPFTVLGPNGEPYAHPFLGGLDVPRPQFADIDGDGDLDLFVQERSDELIFFENIGSSASPEFIWRTDQFLDQAVGDWTRFVDLDDDGDLDLLAERPFSYIQYFRNSGSATNPSFEAVADSVRDVNGVPVFADRQNIPQVADIDCDGVWDLFLGRVDGTVRRYEMAGFGDDGSPRFQLLAERFEDIEIVAQIGSLHGANSMDFIDFEGDGDLDMLWGDFFEPSVLLIRNDGSCERPNMRAEPILVPVRDSLSTSGYNVPVSVDLNGDQNEDLLVGVLGGAFNPNRTASENLQYYQSVDGELVLQTRRFLSGIDIGSETIPAAGDLDGDGDLDLLVGNKVDPAVLTEARMYYFENTGSVDRPEFSLRDTLAFDSVYHYAPALGDLDADGDLDMLLGTWNRGISYYRNDSVDGTEAVWILGDSTFVPLSRGSNPKPALGDLDGDGDLDLIVGEASGELNFVENVGTVTDPQFELIDEQVGSIDVGRRSAPSLVDVDLDGDLDLLVGSEDGGLQLFLREGQGSTIEWVRSFLTSPIPLPPFSTPLLLDIDADGFPELLSGSISGGLVLLQYSGR